MPPTGRRTEGGALADKMKGGNMMDDYISRQSAIEAILNLSDVFINNLPPLKYATDVQEAINGVPSAQPLTDEDYMELRDRFGKEVEFVVEDMISGKGERWGNT